ncbi:MAG: hypothetical protein KJ850_08630 [Gammaproteobacteria bacterium]|nr:hypothetical protein [Gammaproteobacteria bacterium]MBU1625106.1 hypothetical protein [Gammaproteobacteria bacterium]MBU1981366.1 hypothetical protein [Gammaproteobacteria bacterium]
MRFVPTILPVAATPTSRAVKSLSNVHAVKPVHARDPEALPDALHSEEHGDHPHKQEGLPFEDRRKACRRIHNQKVLIELRSGLDRRRHNLVEGGPSDHIDEKV